MMKLIVSTKGSKEEYQFEKDVISIGRSSENDIQILDIKASRKHLQIERFGEDWKVVDLESSNGTLLNGRLINYAILNNNDEIRIGETVITFVCEREKVVMKAQLDKNADIHDLETVTKLNIKERKIQKDFVSQLKSDSPHLEQQLKQARTTSWILKYFIAAGVIIVFLAIFLSVQDRSKRAKQHDDDYFAVLKLFQENKVSKDTVEALSKFKAKYPTSPKCSEVEKMIEQVNSELKRIEFAKTRFENLKLANKQLIEKFLSNTSATSSDLITMYTSTISMREKFTNFIQEYSDFEDYTNKWDAEIKALDTYLNKFSRECIEQLVKRTDDFVKNGNYAKPLEEWKNFLASIIEIRNFDSNLYSDFQKKLEEQSKFICEEATTSYEAIKKVLMQLLEEKKYTEAKRLISEKLEFYEGTPQYFSLNTHLANIDSLSIESRIGEAELAVINKEREIQKLVASANELVKQKNYIKAIEVYEQILSALKEPKYKTLRTKYEHRVADIQGQANLFRKLIDAINSGDISSRTYELPAGVMGFLANADTDKLRITFEPNGELTKKWINMDPFDVFSLYKRLKLTNEEIYHLAVFCYDNKLKKAGNETLYEFFSISPNQKNKVFALISKIRKIETPSDGFVYYKSEWYTKEEERYAKLRFEVDTLVSNIKQNKNRLDSFQRIIDIYNMSENTEDFKREVYDKVHSKLQEMKTNSIKMIKSVPAYAQMQKLKELKKELNKRRKYALEAIFDLKLYPYDEATNNHGEEGQPEVDKRVNAVRELWEKPFDNYSKFDKRVEVVVKDAKEICQMMSTLKAYNSSVNGDDVAQEKDDDELEEVLLLVNEKLNLKNVPVDSQERQIIEYNKKVWEWNKKNSDFMDDQEKEQLRITNEYREMMGLKIVEAQEQLFKAANKHSKNMQAAGRIWHVGTDGSPSSRCAEEGYNYPGGENCYMGGESGQSAFDAWYHSSGHHRNMLTSVWTHLGTAREGMFWTQNFGSGPPQHQNSSDKDKKKK